MSITIISPHRVNWTPADLASGLLMWFDAADEDTITSSLGAVSQWNDKSGNGYHVSQGTGANQPTTGSRTINDLNVIDFNGTTHSLTLGSGPYARNVGSALIIAACHPDVKAGASALCQINKGDSTQTRCKHQVEDLGAGQKWSGAGRRLDADGYTELQSALSFSNADHVFGTIFDYSNAQMNWTVDGTLDSAQSFQTAGNTSDTDSTGFSLGAINGAGSEGFNGAIGEFIIVEDDLTTTTRQLIEGYLMWKWGI